jgi:hypothetical protein
MALRVGQSLMQLYYLLRRNESPSLIHEGVTFFFVDPPLNRDYLPICDIDLS